ncbi:hypothetical protein SBA3_2680019 [Candidatus Sulfopaludibacter sp. SbA3]|nr:hypothetical protein SBA3_2680019 [Candidatus Sulfopaludibacter sp. SbA3]
MEAAVAAGPRYRESLAALGAALPKGGAPADAAVAAAAQTARQIEASFHAYAEGRVDVQVSRMLDEPIAAAKQVLRAGGPAEWNARGADLCTQMKPVLSKYPFATGAVAQASAAEVASLFRPNEGIVWKSYASSLQKLILRKGPRFIASASAGLPVNPAFLAFLDHAAAFSDGAFAGGATQPKIRYTLRPVITPEVDSVKLTIDGQSATFRGNAMAKPFVWSGTGQEMRVSVKFKSKGEFNWSRSATPWSVFLFFDGGGRRQGAQIEIPLRGQTPGSLWFEVTATPPVFDRGYFAGLSCVADIVR